MSYYKSKQEMLEERAQKIRNNGKRDVRNTRKIHKR